MNPWSIYVYFSILTCINQVLIMLDCHIETHIVHYICTTLLIVVFGCLSSWNTIKEYKWNWFNVLVWFTPRSTTTASWLWELCSDTCVSLTLFSSHFLLMNTVIAFLFCPSQNLLILNNRCNAIVTRMLRKHKLSAVRQHLYQHPELFDVISLAH